MDIMKCVRWLVGIISVAAFYILAEGWLIIIVKVFGFFLGTVIVTSVTLILSWVVIYYSSGSRGVGKLSAWIHEKEAGLSSRAQAAAVKGGKFIAVANTTLLLGPMAGSLLMLMLGLDKRRVYFYAIPAALLCAIFWCGLYSGLFLGIKKLMISGS